MKIENTYFDYTIHGKLHNMTKPNQGGTW